MTAPTQPRLVLITIDDDRVASRFDLTTEIVLATFDAAGDPVAERTVVLPQASAEDLCHLVVTEGADVVVCGAIEEEFHQYLGWKRVRVIQSVLGPWREAIRLVGAGTLAPETRLDRAAEATT